MKKGEGMTAIVKPISIEKAIAERWYIGPSEAARKTGLAQTTIHYALHAGTLRGFRVGRRWLIAVDDLHAWIRSEEKAA